MATTTIINTATATPEAAPTGGPHPLVSFGRFGGRSGSRHDLVRTRIDDPAHATRLEELSEREAAEEALDSKECYLHGRVTRCVGLGMFAATAPAGQLQRFLGYFPTVAMAQRAVFEFETASSSMRRPAGRPRKVKEVEPLRETEEQR